MGESEIVLQDDDDVIMIDPDEISVAKNAAITSSSVPRSAGKNRPASIKSTSSEKYKREPTTLIRQPPPETSQPDTAQQAEELKNQGNDLYKEGNYHRAIDLYNQAIDLCPEHAPYYGNRAAAYLMLNKYKQVIDDSKMSTSLDPKFAKGYMREGKAHLGLADCNSALRCLKKAKEIEPHNKTIDTEMKNVETVRLLKEEADSAYNRNDYRKCVYLLNQALEVAINCSAFIIKKAECLVLIGRLEEAQTIAK
jgi:tetratricopeptide (TPR) repeat protein